MTLGIAGGSIIVILIIAYVVYNRKSARDAYPLPVEPILGHVVHETVLNK